MTHDRAYAVHRVPHRRPQLHWEVADVRTVELRDGTRPYLCANIQDRGLTGDSPLFAAARRGRRPLPELTLKRLPLSGLGLARRSDSKQLPDTSPRKPPALASRHVCASPPPPPPPSRPRAPPSCRPSSFFSPLLLLPPGFSRLLKKKCAWDAARQLVVAELFLPRWRWRGARQHGASPARLRCRRGVGDIPGTHRADALRATHCARRWGLGQGSRAGPGRRGTGRRPVATSGVRRLRTPTALRSQPRGPGFQQARRNVLVGGASRLPERERRELKRACTETYAAEVLLLRHRT